MERGNANMPKEAQPFGKEEEKKKQEFACMEEISYPGTVSVGHKPTKHRNLNPLLQEQTVKPLPEPSSQPNVTANKNVENINISRRKKVPWTVEEEKILVEGVRKFSSTDCKDVPWKIILEFGQHVFQKNRKPVDLKDKWRNICRRGDPRARCK
ncbi:hypothetical protein NE237_024687 [Protea cynaroides]|uniref:Myb-like domain-containing protein n=1 Tax=Protea cynaroides TaxID=273540 RepID=A0A9Q0H0D0_9MAGN|nr:hypothetical protein NE237_024687 [Protea cynaroides]